MRALGLHVTVVRNKLDSLFSTFYCFLRNMSREAITTYRDRKQIEVLIHIIKHDYRATD